MSLPYTLPVKAAKRSSQVLGEVGGWSQTVKKKPVEWEPLLGPSLDQAVCATTVSPKQSNQIRLFKNQYLLSTYCVPSTALGALLSLKSAGSCRGAVGRSSLKKPGAGGGGAGGSPWPLVFPSEAVSFPYICPSPLHLSLHLSLQTVHLHPRPQQGQGEGSMALP